MGWVGSNKFGGLSACCKLFKLSNFPLKHFWCHHVGCCKQKNEICGPKEKLAQRFSLMDSDMHDVPSLVFFVSGFLRFSITNCRRFSHPRWLRWQLAVDKALLTTQTFASLVLFFLLAFWVVPFNRGVWMAIPAVAFGTGGPQSQGLWAGLPKVWLLWKYHLLFWACEIAFPPTSEQVVSSCVLSSFTFTFSCNKLSQ